MSILLDALKKSEEQRQLGTTPTIYSSVDGRAEDANPAHYWVPAAMMAVAAIVIAWIGWNQYQAPFNVLDSDGRPPETKIQVAETVAEPEVAENELAVEQEVAVEQQLAVRPPGLRSPIEKYESADNRPPTLTIMPPQTDLGGEERRQRLNQSFSRYEAEDTPAQTGSPAQAAPGAVVPQSDTAGDPRAQQAGAVDNPPVESQEPEPVSYWALPQGVRDKLPDFKISVMVFAEQPADRFLLMDGKRWVEKDSANGVRLDEIRRDGAVFLYQKYRFLVKG